MNPLIAEIPPSLIRSIAARKKPGDIDLGLGEPTIRPPIAPFEAALEWTRANGSPYSPNAGFPELRQAIARYVGGYLGRESGEDEACVTVGSEEALYLAIKTIVDPAHDEVLIVEPCYLAYPKICLLEGVRHATVGLDPADRFAPRAAPVLSAVSDATRLIVLNTPSNPTGRVWPREELERLAGGLVEAGRDDVYVLADEVYRELHFGVPPASIAEYHDRTLIAGSLSKSHSLTGLRLGWLWGPAPMVAAATKVHQFVNTATSTFAQRVAIEIFREPGALGPFRAHYDDARRLFTSSCQQLGLEYAPPEGAFYGFIRLPARVGRDSLAVAERLLEERRVVTVPGAAFGASGEGWIRVSWVAPPDRMVEGLARLADLFAEG